MQKVLFLVNHDIVIYNFRKELVQRLLKEGYGVIISSPYGERIELLKNMGCKYVKTDIDRHGMDVLKELQLLLYYKRLIQKVKPDMVFSYTIKPNIYGALAAASCKIPLAANITGLGMAVEKPGIVQKITILLYKIAFRNVKTVYTQNKANMQFFIDHNIAVDKLKLLPGSGVNLEHFRVLDYPDDERIQFVFISRIMKEKGINQYLKMAGYVKNKYPNTHFHVCGFCEEQYEPILKKYEQEGIITFHGLIMDVREVLAYTHCTIHPTYYPEGLSNVLLESSACGRPIIATDRSGCREVIDDGINGFKIPPQNTKALILAVENFLALSNEERREMGLAGRRKVEKEFNRQMVVEEYMKELGVRGDTL